nr:ATP-binding cassette domain-containing protein [Thermoanaerobacter sp. RKWS2]
MVGLFGLVGAGRTEFGLSLFGNPYGYIISGDIILKGRKVKFKTPEDAIKQGVLYLTEDRKEKGLILINSIKENISLANLKALKKGITVDEAKEIEIAQGFQKKLNIKARNVEVNVSTLSGGTQQKVLVAKGLFAEPDVIILDEPTRGIDVGAKYEIYTLIRELASEGKAILLISSELPEILGMSDRIYIMSKGKITGELKSEEANQEIVMAYAVS